MTVPSPVPTGAGVARVRATVLLTKHEVFDACQALAAADQILVRAGHPAAARPLSDLFELLEDRLTAGGVTRPGPARTRARGS